MMILILGTPDSGKSARAEALTLQLAAEGPRFYVATLEPWGKEGRLRVEKHRAMRAGKGFETLECPRALQSICPCIVPGAAVLLECVTNLVGNEIYAPEHDGWGDEDIVACVLQEIETLNTAAGHLVAVSNCFTAADSDYDAETRRYIRLLNRVNDALRDMADQVHDVTRGKWRIYGDLT